MTILDEILERKAQEVAALRRDEGLSAMRERAEAAPPARAFENALRDSEAPRVISEFKRASPSKGEIRAGADSAEIAKAYEAAGAAALSVLTDTAFFQGNLSDLKAARGACSLPVLRKDFTVDAIQIFEARAANADAVLLIVAALDDSRLADLYQTAREIGLDVLVEVHDRTELERAVRLDARIVGVNNRDLRSFSTDIAVTRELLPHLGGRTIVSESGLSDATTLRELQSEGVHAFLVGEALMKQPDPGMALAKLRGMA
ncbi:MAG: indole-3-glycerol phosphate synthase TrpC [bacterium]|nr:indole-3-glycerol phosphate synthase TrpC [bacterium]